MQSGRLLIPLGAWMQFDRWDLRYRQAREVYTYIVLASLQLSGLG